MEKQPISRMCFGCGIENPIGLKLKLYTDGEGCCIARLDKSTSKAKKAEIQGAPKAVRWTRCWPAVGIASS